MIPDIKLSPEDEMRVKTNLQDLRDYGDILRKLTECGVDCSGLENVRSYMLDKFERINQHFVTPTGNKKLL